MGLFGPRGTRVIVKDRYSTTRRTLHSLDGELEDFLRICMKWDDRIGAGARAQDSLAIERRGQGVTHEGAHVTDREAQGFASYANRERLNFIADVREWLNKEEEGIKQRM